MRTNKFAELIGENGEIPFSIISVVTVLYSRGDGPTLFAGRVHAPLPNRRFYPRILSGIPVMQD